jgi:hypothetical protein
MTPNALLQAIVAAHESLGWDASLVVARLAVTLEREPRFTRVADVVEGGRIRAWLRRTAGERLPLP